MKKYHILYSEAKQNFCIVLNIVMILWNACEVVTVLREKKIATDEQREREKNDTATNKWSPLTNYLLVIDYKFFSVVRAVNHSVY